MKTNLSNAGLRIECFDGKDTCKHISEISAENQEKAKELAEEVGELLKTYGLLSKEVAQPFMERAYKLRLEIVRLGFYVQTVIFLSRETYEFTVEVNPLTSHTKTASVN